MTRAAFTYDGLVYTLDHTLPFILPVSGRSEGAPVFKTLVSFGHHTFTRAIKTGDPAAHHYSEGSDHRCFCPLRYGWSTQLRSVIETEAAGKAYFSEKGNFLFVGKLPDADPYVVVFNVQRVRKANASVSVNVVSAYDKQGLPKLSALRNILFSTLIAKTARGEPIVRPKK